MRRFSLKSLSVLFVKILLGVLLFATLASPCVAATRDLTKGYDYYAQCRDSNDVIDHATSASTYDQQLADAVDCVTFSTGLFYGLSYANGVAKFFDHPLYQEPSEVVIGQRMRILIKYMADHPEQLNLLTIELAHNALKRAYPSQQQNKQKP